MTAKPYPGTPLLASACLIGARCRYDGGGKPRRLLVEMARRGLVLPLCPEQLGGLPTPRPPAELVDGLGEDVLAGRARVLDVLGADRSEAFRRGARETLTRARHHGCRLAVLKERSPSCGVCRLADGREGRGVTAALLAADGFDLISDEDEDLARRLEEFHDADR